MFISSAKRKKSATGSEPGDSTKIKGIIGEASLKDLPILKVGGSINCFPIFSVTKFYMARGILSGLMLLRTIIF